MAAFKQVRPRVWSNGRYLIALPDDKRLWCLYATDRTDLSFDEMRDCLKGKYRSPQNAIKAAERLAKQGA